MGNRAKKLNHRYAATLSQRGRQMVFRSRRSQGREELRRLQQSDEDRRSGMAFMRSALMPKLSPLGFALADFRRI